MNAVEAKQRGQHNNCDFNATNGFSANFPHTLKRTLKGKNQFLYKEIQFELIFRWLMDGTCLIWYLIGCWYLNRCRKILKTNKQLQKLDFIINWSTIDSSRCTGHEVCELWRVYILFLFFCIRWLLKKALGIFLFSILASLEKFSRTFFLLFCPLNMSLLNRSRWPDISKCITSLKFDLISDIYLHSKAVQYWNI